MENSIGLKIRRLRLEQGLTQEELGDRCELTKGYISQLENDLTSPSIETLKDILTALGSNLKEFFSEDEAEEQVVFASKDSFEKKTDDATVRWLVPSGNKNLMEPILSELDPGASSDRDLPHDGEEYGYVLEGEVEIELGSKKYRCSAGDSFYYACARIHLLKNCGKKKAKILWISTPPNF